MILKSMKRILVIDNNIPVLLKLKQRLEKAGYLVVDPSDQQNRIDDRNSDPTDIVVADILHPELAGLKTTIQVKKESPGACMIAKTVGKKYIDYSKSKILQSAKLFDARCIIPYPIDIKELLSAIKELTTRPMQHLRRSLRYMKFKVRMTPKFNISFPGE